MSLLQFGLIIVLRKSTLSCVDFGLRYGQVLLLLAPSVRAVLVGPERRGSLARAHEVPIALALAYELEVALLYDVVDRGCDAVGKAGAAVHLVEVALGGSLVAARADQQLGCVEQCLGITVYAKVVVEVKVAVGSLVLVVLRLCDVLAEEVTSVLVTVLVSTVCIGVEACNVAALVAFSIPLEGDVPGRSPSR